MDGWYYAQNGQSVGPISQAELKQLLASGKLGGDDQVWHSSMASWTAARKVPGLIAQAAPKAAAPVTSVSDAFGQLQPAAEVLASDAPQQQYGQPNAGYYSQQQAVLGYQGSNLGGELVVTARAMGYLRQTRPWAMFIAVLMFIFAGLCALAGIMFLAGGGLIFGGSRGRGGDFGAGMASGMSIAYFVMGFIYFILAFYLAKFSNGIGRVSTSRQPLDLENAIQAQMSFWRLSGIITIVGIALYILLIIVLVSLTRA